MFFLFKIVTTVLTFRFVNMCFDKIVGAVKCKSFDLGL